MGTHAVRSGRPRKHVGACSHAFEAPFVVEFSPGPQAPKACHPAVSFCWHLPDLLPGRESFRGNGQFAVGWSGSAGRGSPLVFDQPPLGLK